MASSPLEPRHSSTNKHNKHRRAGTQVGQRKERRQERIREKERERNLRRIVHRIEELPSAYRENRGDKSPETTEIQENRDKNKGAMED